MINEVPEGMLALQTITMPSTKTAANVNFRDNFAG